MIPDWETNHLFISDRLEEVEPQLFAFLKSHGGFKTSVIQGTHDIWCRDFMPIQLDESEFSQFIYSPDYLRGFEHLITPPEKCRLPFMTNLLQEQIVLDGGNVVASRSKVILTDKIYKENGTFARPELRKRLEGVFKAECIIIPKQAGDHIGHSDGVIRYIAEDRVLMNDYSQTDPSYGERVHKVLEKHGLKVETLPMFEEVENSAHTEIPPAVGIYTNYLRVGDIIIVPSYGSPVDQEAFETMQRILPNSAVHQTSCRNLAQQGGVLNCISWTVKLERSIDL